jgi:hypothetical protein
MPETDRHYKHSDLRAVSEEVDSPLSDEQREILRILYGEVCNTWRALLDVRFKLLGLVPFVTVAVLVVLLPDSGSATLLESWSAAVICLLGLVVTLGLLIYEIRNSELYDDLVSRGRRIEAELGIHTGIFRGRRMPKRPIVHHGTAIFLIYLAALAGWAYGLIISLGL